MSRDILAPPLQRMGPNRCYRVNMVHDDFSSQQSSAIKSQQGAKAYVENDLYGDEFNDELDGDGECEIEEISSDVFKLAMHVASPFYGGIIGQKGTTKRRIEAETHCSITIPQKMATGRTTDSKVIIKGQTRNSVATAKRKILLLVTSLRKRMKATHFFGIALNTGEIKENFNNLQAQIMAAEIPGIDKELFQLDFKLHLTFFICVLLDDEERKTAVNILQSCREFLSDSKTPFSVKVSGLEIMNDDPSAVRVLYAAVQAPELEIFANRCMERFVQSGLGIDDFDRGKVKLHMTIMNNRYRQTELPDSKTRNFDAREILKRWGNFHFGSAACDEVVVCAMGGTRDTKEFYKITGSLKLT